jgi:antirestriction protein ArdC
MKSVAYEAVYNQIIKKMEEGIIPWKKPWKCCRPCNAKTGRPYNGVNFFLLSMTDFGDNRWITYKQLQELGGNIKKGEKSTQVVFWQILNKDDNGKNKSIPLLKYFNVFNIEQTEGVEWEKVQVEPNRTAENIVEGYTDKPVIKYLGNKACYIPSKDEVNMPPVNFFDSVDEFYSTLFHELSHSVLHETRMNRKIDTVFGSKLYTEQELEAEFASAFLCNESGVDNTLENSAAYIQSWMKSFKDNPAMIITAASKAQKTADYILGMNEEKGE